jgi:hypothetical protein
VNYIYMLFSICGVLLNAKKVIWCWPIWCVGNLGWMYNAYVVRDWPQFAVWVVFTLANLYAWRCWQKDARATNLAIADSVERVREATQHTCQPSSGIAGLRDGQLYGVCQICGKELPGRPGKFSPEFLSAKL